MDRKKLLLICCGILFANILVAQTIFTIDGLVYERVDVATVKVAIITHGRILHTVMEFSRQLGHVARQQSAD